MGSGRVALVTGSSSGIGLAVARALLEEGWAVCLNGRDEARLRRAHEALSAGGADAIAVAGDVSRPATASDLVRRCLESFGGLDLLVNNAGIGVWGRVEETTLDDWERVLAIDLTSVFLLTKEALPHLRRRRGYVVNIASLAGKKGMPGSSAYCAAKHGVLGFTDSLLREEKESGVRATSICPGYVATPMALGNGEVPAEEMVQPEDVAATVRWLLALSPKVVVREVVLERTGAV